MRFGVLTGFGTLAAPAEVAALVAHVEGLGFDSVWLTEHVLFPATYAPAYPYTADGVAPIGAEADLPDPLVWLAFAAAGTTRLLLGTACIVLPQRRPAVLAKQAATLDRLSKGRLRLGVGLGWMREEAAAVGSSWADRARRTDEGIAALRALWGEQPVALPGGPAFSLPRPATPGGPPIVVCGPSHAAAARAGRLGDGWFSFLRDRPVLAGRLATLREAAAAAGRDPSTIEVTAGAFPHPRGLDQLAGLGVDRAVFTVPCRGLDRTRRQLDKLAALL